MLGFEAIGIAARPNIPIIIKKIITRIVVLNLLTAVLTIPIIYILKLQININDIVPSLRRFVVDEKRIEALRKRSDNVVYELANNTIILKRVYSNLDSALIDKNYDAAIICSPTSLHIEQCNILSSKKVNLMNYQV